MKRKLELIEEYQCPGCVNGSNTKCGAFMEGFYDKAFFCKNHVIGTMEFGVGKFALGMPRGFNRQGESQKYNLYFVTKLSEMLPPDEKTIYNIPVWKMKQDGKVFVKVLSPRINVINVVVIDSEDGFDTINCVDVTGVEMD